MPLTSCCREILREGSISVHSHIAARSNARVLTLVRSATAWAPRSPGSEDLAAGSRVKYESYAGSHKELAIGSLHPRSHAVVDDFDSCSAVHLCGSVYLPMKRKMQLEHHLKFNGQTHRTRRGGHVVLLRWVGRRQVHRSLGIADRRAVRESLNRLAPKRIPVSH